jgi:oxazoline/thiazoline dehydrogenase
MSDDAFVLALHDETTVDTSPHSADVSRRGRRLRLPAGEPGVAEALALLRRGAARSEIVADHGPRLIYYLGLLEEHGLVVRSVHDGAVAVATCEASAAGYRPPSRVPDPDAPYTLSRFAYLRAEDGAFVLESPLSRCTIALHAASALAAVQRFAAGARWPSATAELSPSAGGALAALLCAAGVVVPAGPEPDSLRVWAFHDLLFHARSRQGRHRAAAGGTYRFAGEIPMPPALPAPRPVPRVALREPDLARAIREDPPFAVVQERRRSVRSYGPQPIGAAQLGEFLYRVARVTGSSTVVRETVRGPVETTIAHRPFPGGGGLYELEIYPVVARAGDLAPGLYHYDPAAHELEAISPRTPAVDALLRVTGRGAGIAFEDLQVVLVVSARFARFMWKYESMAYAAILKNVGVLYQTMYLVATAMGLAPCAVGCGDSDLFAAAAGLDYVAETSVGEFLLGSSHERFEEAESVWRRLD